MKLYMIAENLIPLLYRSDEQINSDVDGALLLIKSGRYTGRYYTSSKHDAAIYYPTSNGSGKWGGHLLIARIADGLVTDGHLTDSVLLDGDEGRLDGAIASLEEVGVPEDVVLKFKQLVGDVGGDVGGDVAHYSGVTSREKFEFLKMIFRYTGPKHLRDHGQVALLDRNLQADEFVDLVPYSIENGSITFRDESIPVKAAYRPQFA